MRHFSEGGEQNESLLISTPVTVIKDPCLGTVARVGLVLR